jgi:type I restriction enzyme S subunit
MSFPRYLAYKDSGVEWLGEVPEHWQAVRFSRLISAIKDGTHGTYARVSDGLPLLSAKNVLDGQLDVGESESLISESDHEEITSNGFPRKGDLLLTIVGTLGRCCVFEQNEPIAFQRSVCFIRLRNDHFPKFFYFVTQSQFFQEQLVGRSKSAAQAGVYMGDVAGMTVLLPPYNEEQKAIASFLDRETAKIDALVAEQEQLITLLKEKRQAVISHAVTKGLDPSVPMKDSGVEWLGEVPEHWSAVRLKFLASDIKAGPFGSALTKDMYASSGYRVYGQEQVIPGDFSIGDYYIDEATFAQLAQYATQEGDVLISCVGTFGKIAVVPESAEPGIINPRLIRLRVVDEVSPNYLAEVLRSTVTFEQFSVLSRGGTMDVINIGTLSDIWVAVPPYSEQQTILGELQKLMREFDALVDEAVLSIELLRERRSALISAAVTGQIDVRGLAHQEAA